MRKRRAPRKSRKRREPRKREPRKRKKQQPTTVSRARREWLARM